MALERRPIPVLEGKAAEEFWEKVENFKITETPEEIRRTDRWMREAIEKAEKRDRREL